MYGKILSPDPVKRLFLNGIPGQQIENMSMEVLHKTIPVPIYLCNSMSESLTTYSNNRSRVIFEP
jgi:hypothetical protein